MTAGPTRPAGLPPLHPQVQALVDREPADDGLPPDLAEWRTGYLRTALELGGAPEPVAEVRDVVIPRAGGRICGQAFFPQVAPPDPPGLLVWCHGGGWVAGDLPGIERVCRALANASGAICVSIDYRLAPEHPFPAAVDDATAALRWALGDGAAQLGADPARVGAGGDSAGANLTAVAVRRVRDAGLPGPCLQVLAYPPVDAAMDTPSYEEFAGGPMLRRVDMEACWDAYLAGADRADPDASPLRAADLAGLPPAFIVAAGYDVLRDEACAYADALRAAGVAVELERFDDMCHGFIRMGGVLDRGRELIATIGARTRAAMQPRD